MCLFTYPSECFNLYVLLVHSIVRDINVMFIFSIEGEFVPLPGDKVRYRLCPIPPKLEKCQAVRVDIINLTPQVHLKWDSPEN